MAEHESSESNPEAADRRSFMKTAVKTVVAGAAVAGIAGASSTAQAASCGGSLIAPKAVVKANVVFNNQQQVKRDEIIALINTLFNGSFCTFCGLNGFPGPRDPGTIIEINISSGFLPSDQQSNVIFTEAG
jgi:hypothetical protein